MKRLNPTGNDCEILQEQFSFFLLIIWFNALLICCFSLQCFSMELRQI